MTFRRKGHRLGSISAVSIGFVVSGTLAAGVASAVTVQDGPSFHEREVVAGAKTFKKVQTAATARITNSTSFTNFTSASVPIAAGRSALINVKWAGETACFGGGTGGNWCTMRVRVGGVEAHPQSGSDFAIDSTNQGREGASSWEGHLIERHRCVRNTTTTTINVPVAVDWAVTSSATTFRADDWALDIQRADNCSPAQ